MTAKNIPQRLAAVIGTFIFYLCHHAHCEPESYINPTFLPSETHAPVYLPVNLMHNEALFMAAEIRLNSNQTRANRILNNTWLRELDGNTYSGIAAIRMFLRSSLSGFFDQPQYLAQTNSFSKSEIEREIFTSDYDTLGFSEDLRNEYKLQISGSKLILALQRRF